MRVEITCKDPSIQRYCQKQFVDRWNRDFGKYTGVRAAGAVVNEFQDILAKEAKRQEWYDYAESGDGLFVPHARFPIMEDGKPKLLIPEVKVVS
jgi:hypothetical protein